jgi:hypothetical protein
VTAPFLLQSHCFLDISILLYSTLKMLSRLVIHPALIYSERGCQKLGSSPLALSSASLRNEMMNTKWVCSCYHFCEVILRVFALICCCSFLNCLLTSLELSLHLISCIIDHFNGKIKTGISCSTIFVILLLPFINIYLRNSHGLIMKLKYNYFTKRF